MRPTIKLWLATCFGLGFLLMGGALLFKSHRSSLVPPFSAKPESLPKPLVTINDQHLSVELADTPEKQRQGLAGHEPLTDFQGMLFPFDSPRPVTFWMKGMTFPIDMIYLAEGRVVQIYANVPAPQPQIPDQDLARYPSKQSVDYVLETRAGWAQDYQISVGDAVTFNF
jgi:hypothetical protein